ncbi:MAG: hypothetical protein CMD03_04685 [Flavobacteriales bacterium]|nr:hypothetical protein [Flavobacteriales bacterium]
MKKIILLFVFITFNFTSLYAQDVLQPPSIKDMNSVYKKDRNTNKKIQEYTHLREADVMWSRKIWRDIDLRQKINHPFYYPMNDGNEDAVRTDDRRSLIDVIYSAVAEGTITAYDPKDGLDDEFRETISEAEIISRSGAGMEVTTKFDQDLIAQGVDPELAQYQDTIYNPFDRNIIKKWRLKEEWFFDKQRSVMDVRIIGMAPLKEDRDEDNNLTGTFSPLFWVWFPETRKVLIKAEVFNLVKNDAERRTYDDIFWKRMFSSTIFKEANVMDRQIDQYMVGLDALLEAEKIKEELFNFEHDLWEY